MKYLRYIFLFFLILPAFPVLASVSEGTIDATDYTAHLCANDDCSENSSINFLITTGESVTITDSALMGEIWSENMGWIKLDPTTSGVTNTSEGVLGGYAWGEIMGWINFAPTQGGVSINATGEFTGWAWAENAGWIKFDCGTVGACVKTDWRPLSARPRTIISGSYIIPKNPVIFWPIVFPWFPYSTIVPVSESNPIKKKIKESVDFSSRSISHSLNGMFSSAPENAFLKTPSVQIQDGVPNTYSTIIAETKDNEARSMFLVFIDKVKEWIYTIFSNIMNFLFSLF